MISVQEAQQIVRQNLPTPAYETIALRESLGRTLAEDIVAAEPSPRFTNSAMDGFAVRWADVRAAAEGAAVELTVVGESQAGVPFARTLKAGEAVRISTGGQLCEGADTIIPIEEAEVQGQRLRVLTARKKHQHVRFRGEEFPAGAPLLSRGVTLHPAQIAVLAAQGISRVQVFAGPGVSIIRTGTELVPFDTPPGPGQIRDSNGIMLENAVRMSGGMVALSASVGDNLAATVKAVQEAMQHSRLILFSGGVSVGPHDLVKTAARECGFETLFWRVRQKPGKPLFFARHDQTLFFGLPGNPVSAYMCYQFYVHPVLQYLTGRKFAQTSLAAMLTTPVENTLERAQLFRVSIETPPRKMPRISPLPKQGSHMLTSISDAGGFILLEVGASLAEGEIVDVFTFV